MSGYLEVTRGDDKYFTFEFKDEAGVAIDITGWTVYFTVKEDPTDSDDDAKIKKDQSVHSDAVSGKTTIHLENTETNLLGQYFYDIQIKKPGSNGDVFTVVPDGVIVFKQDITQRA